MRSMKKIYVATLLFFTIFAIPSLMAQNVGVGESSPATKLEIKGDAGTDLLNVKDQDENSRLYIENTGNVGVGTIEPWLKLDILGATYLRGAATHSIDAEQLRFGRSDLDVRYHSIHSQHTGTGSGNHLQFKIHDGVTSTSQTDLMILRGDGRVGIRATNPAATLHVNGSIRFQSLINGYLKTNGDGDISTVVTIPASDITGIDESKWTQINNDLYPNSTGWNVGIGLSNPSQKLEVAGQALADAFRTRSGNTLYHHFIRNGGGAAVYINQEDGSNPILRLSSGTATANGNVQFTVENDGKVGVGTDGPTSKLHVLGTGGGDGTWNQGILIENNNASAGEPTVVFKNSATGSNYWFTGLNQSERYEIAYGTGFTNPNTYLTIASDGNVGIGTVSPGTKLDIKGNVQYPINILRTGNNGDVGIEFHDNDANAQTGYFTFDHTNTDSEGNGASFHFRSTETTLGVILEGQGGYYAGDEVVLRSNGSSYLTGGNVGIGISSPSSILHVGSTSDDFTDNKVIKVESRGYAGIELLGDRDNRNSNPAEPGGA